MYENEHLVFECGHLITLPLFLKGEEAVLYATSNHFIFLIFPLFFIQQWPHHPSPSPKGRSGALYLIQSSNLPHLQLLFSQQ